MALQKIIALPNSASGNYIKVGAFTWDVLTRESSCHLMLFASAAAAASAPAAPLAMIGKLRLNGAKFDQYLSTAALAALPSPGPDPIRDQLYAAAKAEPLVPGAGLTAIDLSDATDV